MTGDLALLQGSSGGFGGGIDRSSLEAALWCIDRSVKTSRFSTRLRSLVALGVAPFALF
jgi:hypothetical protein